MFEELGFHFQSSPAKWLPAMTMSGMPRHQRPFSGACLLMFCLVQLCLALLQRFSDLNSFSFVQSASCNRHTTIEGQMSLRSVGKRQADSVEPEPDSKAEAKQYTVAVKRAPTPKNLIETLDWAMGRPIFDYILASAAYTQLAYFTKRRVLEQADWDSPVLLRLHARVADMVLQDKLGARETANVLWSLGKLADRFSVPTELLDALVESVPTHGRGMDEQTLSNSLWACAKLKDVAPGVLKAVPAIAAQIPRKAKDMIPQHLSNCLLSVLQLEDDVPEVLEIVPAILGEIPRKIKDMNSQDLNSLEALVLLRDSVPKVAGFLSTGGTMDDIVTSAAARLNKLLPQVTGKDLRFTAPVMVWACAKVGVFHHELLTSVAQRLGSRKKMSALADFAVGVLLWSYQVLDSRDEFGDFRKLLKEEAKSSKRRLSEADVQSCELGRFRWNRA